MGRKKILLLIGLIAITFESFSTHIRAGEIIIERIDFLTYRITFFGYRDQEGVLFGQGRLDFGDGEIYGDDPDEQIPWTNITDLGNGVERWQFSREHTYQAANAYTVSYTEDFRNANIQNITGSVNTPFYIESQIIIDPLIGVNNSPVFTVPPIDQGVVGFRFEHNPGAFDPDGDSLAYEFVIPLQAKGIDVAGYRSLVDPSFYDNFPNGNQAGDGPPTLTLDEINGTLVWDAPGGVGIPEDDNREFNIAFIVREYRFINGEWFPLGFVKRDMQIIIWNFDNDPPEIELPPDTCVVAGETITATVIGTDPDNDPVKLEALGGPFVVNPPIATANPPAPGQFTVPPSFLTFEWQTVCGHVRARPYEVQFKATDDPTIPNITDPPGSVNFETWRLTVVGPAPTGLVADTQPGRSIQLNWDDYSCSNADSIQVWRRVGEFDIDPTCEPGIPQNAGYELVDVLDAAETSLLDNNDGLGLSPGSKYCYRLVATFPDPTGGLSIASDEACDSLLIDVPLITNVDIRTTSETNGEILVRWTPPYQIDVGAFPPDYGYSVLRAEGQGPTGDFVNLSTNQADTFFIDTGMNTEDLFHAYKIVLHDNTGVPIDTSVTASSIRLEPRPQVGAIQLNWEGNVPWSLNVQDFPYHYIWRDNVDNSDLSAIQLIDSVDVTMDGLTYLDNGSFNGVDLDDQTTYCYFVTTSGSYGNALVAEPLENNTQIICAQPNDTIPPCTPVSIVFDTSAPFSCDVNSADQGCDFNDFQNRLIWEPDNDLACGDDIQSYQIYFSDTGEEGSYVALANTTETSFTHGGLSSYAGCYIISAIDRSGNESILSEPICNDNCPQLILPNLFTPNGDGLNDFFRPFYSGSRIGRDIDGFANSNCPRFVKSINFTVFNRAGATVFSYDSSENENDFLINWNGTNSGGGDLPEGAYFYSAEVTFERLNPDDEVEVYSGWVQILR